VYSGLGKKKYNLFKVMGAKAFVCEKVHSFLKNHPILIAGIQGLLKNIKEAYLKKPNNFSLYLN
jgi:hypothetical protein